MQYPCSRTRPQRRVWVQRNQGRPNHNPLPAHAPFRDPPQRMGDQAKAAWHATPEVVRGDIHRMHRSSLAPTSSTAPTTRP